MMVTRAILKRESEKLAIMLGGDLKSLGITPAEVRSCIGEDGKVDFHKLEFHRTTGNIQNSKHYDWGSHELSSKEGRLSELYDWCRCHGVEVLCEGVKAGRFRPQGTTSLKRYVDWLRTVMEDDANSEIPPGRIYWFVDKKGRIADVTVFLLAAKGTSQYAELVEAADAKFFWGFSGMILYLALDGNPAEPHTEVSIYFRGWHWWSRILNGDIFYPY